MRTAHIITVPLAVVLSAALAVPAAAVPTEASRDTSTQEHVGTSTTTGSPSDGLAAARSPDAKDAATANRSVPSAEASSGDAAAPAAGAWTERRTVGPPPAALDTPSVDTRAAGFDWGSAAIGAVAAIGACAIALAAAAGMRRRRPARPGAVAPR